ncbi:NADH dehydrogenase subunit J [Anseongella ginsenosidimutans]|uniref:NADH-quinone oxidoreductase subunit J n=2 Tax=Anseongella ginsenosidimutans TaxID=496056 RepID=A0A4R3KRR6_9SPHI|nr:NADH dehydrogenase subunit J [Anseongella ginsenosidimutans]
MLSAALYVAVSRDIARAIFCFFGVLFALAGLYIFALADFVAVTQILVYAGGVVVLMIFALMLTDKQLLEVIRKEEKTGPRLFRARSLPSILLALGVLAVLLQVAVTVDWSGLQWLNEASAAGNRVTGKENMVENVGINLMTRYLLPFEVISVLLLAALIGAAYLARGRK